MNIIDYELGLMSSEEDFQNADGLVSVKAAKLALVAAQSEKLACTKGCFQKHPFDKIKRNDCFGKCIAAYKAKVSYINENIATLKEDEARVEAIISGEISRLASEKAARRPLGIAKEKRPLGIAKEKRLISSGASSKAAEAAEASVAETGKVSDDSDKKGLGTGVFAGMAILVLVGVIVLVIRKKM